MGLSGAALLCRFNDNPPLPAPSLPPTITPWLAVHHSIPLASHHCSVLPLCYSRGEEEHKHHDPERRSRPTAPCGATVLPTPVAPQGMRTKLQQKYKCILYSACHHLLSCKSRDAMDISAKRLKKKSEISQIIVRFGIELFISDPQPVIIHMLISFFFVSLCTSIYCISTFARG